MPVVVTQAMTMALASSIGIDDDQQGPAGANHQCECGPTTRRRRAVSLTACRPEAAELFTPAVSQRTTCP